MQVLYIKRSFSNRSGFRRLWRELRRRLFFYGQEGFFEASLHEAFPDITEVTARQVMDNSTSYTDTYDLVVVNKKSVNTNDDTERRRALRNIAGNFSVPTVLLDAGANAGDVPPDAVFAAYDLVFKREHFKDPDRYDLSAESKAKLHTTMLPCLYVPLPRNWLGKLLAPIFIPQAPKVQNTNDKEHDVFFSGTVSDQSLSRIKAVEALVDDPEIRLYGGLQPKTADIDVPKKLQFPRLDPKEYAQALQSSKIILALDGYGQLTFRHLEAWHFGGFLLSSPSIRDITMPLPAQEGVHYVAFDDMDDLVDVVQYYLQHEDERKKIASAGKQMFVREYDPKKHGQYIQKEVRKIMHE